MKTTMKNRIVSAILALAMLVSFLPANIFPQSIATAFDSGSIVSIDAETGDFTVTFTKNTSAVKTGSTVLAVFPNLGNGVTPRQVPPTPTQSSSAATLGPRLEQYGIPAETFYVEDLPSQNLIPIAGNKYSVTLNGSLGKSFSDIKGALVAAGLLDESASEIPYMAILYSQEDPATRNITDADYTYAGEGSISNAELNVYYTWDDTDGFVMQVNGETVAEDGTNLSYADGYFSVPLPLKNTGGVATVESIMWTPGDQWSDGYSADPIEVAASGNEGGGEIYAGEEAQLLVDLSPVIPAIAHGNGQLVGRYYYEGGDTHTFTVTVNIETDWGWTIERDIKKSVMEPYTPENETDSITVSWKGPPLAVGLVAPTGGLGTVEYSVGEVETEYTLNSTDSFTITFTPGTKEEDGSYTPYSPDGSPYTDTIELSAYDNSITVPPVIVNILLEVGAGEKRTIKGLVANGQDNWGTVTVTSGAKTDSTTSSTVAAEISDLFDGDKVTVEAVAKPGYRFKNWSGASTSTNAKLTDIAVSGNATYTANFEISGIKWKDLANPQTIIYGETISAKTWTAIPDDLVNGKLPITYSVTDWGGLQSYLDEANTPTTNVTSGTPNGGLTLTNKSGQKIPKGTYTITVTASNGVATDITSQVVITVNAKPLPKPTIAIEGNATIPAGSSIGAVKHTNANNADYAAAGVSFELLNAAGVSVGTYNETTFVYSGLPAGVYHVKGTMTNPNYTWSGTNGDISDTVEIEYAGVTQPTLEGAYTFEKNDSVRAATPTGASYTYTTGSWTDVASVRIDGTALASGEYSAVGGTITISNAVIKSKNLTNGDHTITATFSDSNGYQSESGVISGGTLSVQTTYTVTFKDNDGGALSSSTSIADVPYKGGTTAPTFDYSAINNLPTKVNYTLQGWAASTGATTATWKSSGGTTYTPATTAQVMDDTKWNTEVYAVWDPVDPKLPNNALVATVGDDLTGAKAHPVGTITMPSGTPSTPYTLVGTPTLPAGLTLNVDPTSGAVTITGTPTTATSGAVDVTYTVTAGNGGSSTQTVKVTVNKKKLTDPTLTKDKDLSMAGANDGEITLTLPAWPAGAVNTNYKLQRAPTENGSYTDVGTLTAAGSITGLAPGWYRVVATLADTNSYEWDTGNDGISNSVQVKDKTPNLPQVTQAQTYERNTAITTRPSSVTFNFNVGDWATLTGFKVNGSTQELVGKEGVKVTQPSGDGKTGSIMIPATVLDGLGLSNGTNQQVTATFSRPDVTPLTQTDSKNLLTVQTTYTVTFAPGTPSGATAPATTPTIDNKTVTGSTAPAFPYTGNGGIQNNYSDGSIAGYAFKGWSTPAGSTPASPTLWTSGNYTPAVNDWNSTVTAQWLENTITVTANKNGAAENGKTFVLVGNTDGSVISGTKGSGSSSNVTTFHAVPAGQTYTIHEGDATTHTTTGYPAQSVTVGGNTPVVLHYYQVNVAKPVKAEDTSVEVTGGTSSIYIGTKPATPPTSMELLYNSSTKGSATISASETDPDYIFSKWVDAPANGGTEPTSETGTYRLTANNTNIKGPIVLTPQYSKNSAALLVTVTKDGQPVEGATVSINGTAQTTKTDNKGQLRITGLAGSTTGTVYAVTTDVGTGTRSATITGTTDGATTLNYYTVTAVASSSSADSASVQVNSGAGAPNAVVLETATGNSGNAVQVVASPKPGYKTPAKWSIVSTTYQANGTPNAPTTDTSKTGSPLAVTVNATIEATASFDPIKITLGDGKGSVVWGNPITSLSKVPAVEYEAEQTYASDTPDYYVLTDDADTTSWGTSREKNGIKLERNDTNTGWKVSGTPTSATITSVTFDIRVVSDNGTEATNTVTITISKAPLNRVKVTDIKTPTPGTNPSGAETADLPGPDPDPSSNPYYGDDTDGKFGDEEATVTWKDKDGNPVTGPFKYGEPYTAEVVVKPDDNHVFADNVTTNATPTDNPPYTPKTETVTKNSDGTVTVTYTFPAVYQLVYSSNSGGLATGTDPASQNVKLNDTVTIAADPNYNWPGYKGHFGWANTDDGAKAYDFSQADVSITQAMIDRATADGKIILYYVWQSSEMATARVDMEAVYAMNATQWTATAAGTAKYQGRDYAGLVAPGVINVTGDNVDLPALVYTLSAVNGSSFNPNDYFDVVKDNTSNIASLVMKSGAGVTIPDVSGSPYSFTVSVKNPNTNKSASATYTLTVRPIEIDHVALDGVTAPVQGVKPVTSVNKADNETTWPNWKSFYNASGVSVSWAPSDDPYKKGQSYTATITLTPKDTNYIFVQPDVKSTGGSVYAVGTDTVIDDTATNPLGNWNHTLSTTQVVLTRTFPLTGISTTATLSPKAWNQLTVSGFTADTQVPVNMYYLIYDTDMSATLDTAAKVKAAYDAAKTTIAGSGTVPNLIALDEQGNVSLNASGVATYPGQPITVTNGVVGDHTYYLYVVAEAVSDNTVLATANDDAATPKKLTLSHNGYGKVDWTGNTNIPDVGTSKTLPANADLSHNTTNTKVISMFENGTFTATPNDANKFGFVKWTLAKSGAAAADAGTTNKYDYKASGDGANTNDETLHAIFHRKINGTFSIGDDEKTNGKTYTPNLSAVNIGAVAQTTQAGLESNSKVTYQWYYGAGSADASTDTGWNPIPGATSFTWTNTNDDYSGSAFRLKITYHDDENGGDDSWIAAKTGTSVNKLATPAPVLKKVERDVTDTFVKPDGTTVDNNEGGLHLSFLANTQDKGAGANTPVDYYAVTLTGNGKTLTVKIAADGRTGDYYYYWPAAMADVLPGHSFTVSVKAVSKGDGGSWPDTGLKDQATNGWLNSDPGTATADAGYKTLYMNQLTGSFTDKVFNGTAQTGGTITAPPGAGAVTVTYAPTVGGTAAANQTSVNLAENTSPAPSDGTNPDHDYYIYVSVAQGTLYLALEGQFTAASTNVVSAANAQVTTADGKKVNTDRGPDLHADWEIVQAQATMSTITPPSGKQTGEAVNVLNGKTTTTSYAGAANGKYKESGNTTKYYNITYYLRSIEDAGGNAVTDPVWTAKIGTAIPLTGTAGECMTSFIPNVGANYKFEAVATYSDQADDQFKADVSEVSQTFTYAIGVRTITKIDLLRHEAWNGTTGVDRKDGATSLDPTWNANRAVTYGNSEEGTGLIGFYDAGTASAVDAGAAKQMRLEGLKLYITYSNKTHSEHVLQADGTWDVPLPAGYTYTWNSSNTGTANAPAITDRYLTFKGAGINTGLSITSTPAAGGTAIKSNDVTYTMAKRPLPYTITVEDPAEKVWNGKKTDSTIVPNDATKDRDRNGDPVQINVSVTDLFAVADNVTINANGYKSRKPDNTADDSTVGKDRVVVAKNAQPSGNYRAFYSTGTATNDTIDIYPAHVTKVNVVLPAPDPKKNSKISSYAANTNTRTNETNTSTGEWTVPPIKIEWKIWDGTDWADVTKADFEIDKLYKAIVTIEADGNNYLSDEKTPYVYTINGKKDGEPSFDDLDEWNNREEIKASVTVDKEKPIHGDLNVLYHNQATFSIVFHTYDTPQLQFSDDKGSVSPGTDCLPSNYAHHTEVVTAGSVSGDISYTITVNARTKDIYGVKVVRTNSELLNAHEDVKLEAVQKGTEAADGTVTAIRSVTVDGVKIDSVMYMIEGNDDYDPTQDLIIYKLTIPNALTQNEGIYHLELQAMGSSSPENYKMGKVDVAQCYYSFTLDVRPKPQPGGSGGTTTVETPIVRYWISDYGYTNDLTAEKMPRAGAKPSFTPKITPMAGLRFLGWSETDPTKLEPGKLPTLVDPLTFTIDEDKIFYAVYEWVGHSHYVIGFPDGTFGPDNSITRGQVATIIARACLEGFVEGSDYGNPGNYSDVGDHWAASAVAYCSLRGVFAGYEDGTFRPDRYISRQELATVVARLAGVQANQGLTFTDSGDVASWALNGVYTNVANGWVNGYEDNTFRPLQNITRAETVKIFNGYLGRGVDAKGLEGLTEYVHSGVASNTSGSGEENKEYMTWPDVTKAHWAYFEVIEAANDHDYHWQDNAKATPPEQWDAAYIDETWRYYDNENDGGQNVGLEAKTFTVTYMIPDGEPVTETVKIYESPSVEGLPQLTAPEGFYLAGWSLLDPSLNEITENDLLDPTAHWVEEDRTYYPVFEKIPEYVMPDVVVTYDIGVHGTTTGALTETVKMYESPTVAGLPKITAEAGYRFAGWTRKDPAVYEIATEDLEDPTASPVLEDTTFYAVYVDRDGHVLPTVVVTYVIGEQGATAMATTELVEMYESPTVEALPNVAANEGWQFLGWSETDPATLAEGETPALVDPTASPVTADKSFYAVYTPAQPGETQPPVETEQPEETQQPEQVTVTYLVSSNGVTYDSISETLAWGTAPAAETLPIAVPNPGYRFAGWSATDPSAGEISLVDPTATAITEDRNFYAVFQPEEIVPPEETPQPPVDYDRTSYINGFGEGEFRPDEAINRAAVASIIANLNGYDAGQQYSEADGYADLEGHWAKNVIAFCIQKGLLSGYEDGTFRPDRSISRQEFAVVISRMAGVQSNEGLSFTDVDAIAPWALDGVYTAYVNGWIGGYEDGTFLPEKSITRAEAVKVFNAYLGRSANPAAIQAASDYTVWNDVADTHWAYYEIIEASNNWEEPLPAPEESEEPQPPEETTPVDESDPSQLPSGEEVKPVDNGETVNPSDEEDAEPDQSGSTGPEPEPAPGEGETE